MTTKTWGRLGVLAVIAAMAISYQNCSGKGASGADSQASACIDSSVLRAAYPQDNSFEIPLGTTHTPYACINQSDSTSLVFSASKQTVTLQGSSGSKVFNLLTGGDPCSRGNKIGGDRWRSSSGETLDTNLGTDSIQITYKNDITCTTTL
jgi:hypothetical protein